MCIFSPEAITKCTHTLPVIYSFILFLPRVMGEEDDGIENRKISCEDCAEQQERQREKEGARTGTSFL